MKFPWSTTLELAAVACGFFISTASATVAIDWVNVGDSGNAAQSAANRDHVFSSGDGRGAVAYQYNIARNETTLAEYTAFLNAAAAADPYNLYNPSMESNANIAGISRSGTSGSFSYSVIGSGDRPVTYVSWFDAARFVNWLHNGQGSGSTETGVYTLLNGQIDGLVSARNPGALVWIPTLDEWYKAAYYDPTKDGDEGGYWLYPNQTDVMTSNDIGVAGAANHRSGQPAYLDYATTPGIYDYSADQNYLTDVGAYGTSSQSHWGTNDQAGNVSEWIDLTSEFGTGRGIRGGAWDSNERNLGPIERLRLIPPSSEVGTIGFRVASVPEPSMVLTMTLFGMALVSRRKR